MGHTLKPGQIPFQNVESLRALQTLTGELGGLDIAYFTPEENAKRGYGDTPYSIYTGIAVMDGDIMEVLPASTGNSPDEALASLLQELYQRCVKEGLYLTVNNRIFNLVGEPGMLAAIKCPASLTPHTMTTRHKPGGPILK